MRLQKITLIEMGYCVSASIWLEKSDSKLSGLLRLTRNSGKYFLAASLILIRTQFLTLDVTITNVLALSALWWG